MGDNEWVSMNGRQRMSVNEWAQNLHGIGVKHVNSLILPGFSRHFFALPPASAGGLQQTNPLAGFSRASPVHKKSPG